MSAEQAGPAWTVRGNPSDEELAAVVTVLSTRSTPEPKAPPEQAGGSGWSAYWRGVRKPLVHGPGAWRGWP